MRLRPLLVVSRVTFICILFCTTFLVSICNGQHSSAYYKYQEGKAFKGIKFGTSYSEATKRLSLKPTSTSPLFQNQFEIKNVEYLEYGSFKFNSGYAYFTKAGKLYMIVLHTSPASPPYQEFNAMKYQLTKLFGHSDGEYTYSPKENFIQHLQVHWGGLEGTNLYINVMVMPPSSGEKTTIELTILDNKLNSEANREWFNSSEEGSVPKY